MVLNVNVSQMVRKVDIMKTMQQWDKSGIDFGKFAQPGDEIDEAMFMYFLEVLPPARQMSYGFLVGEPYDHRGENNKARFDAFYESPDGKKYYYGGLKSIRQFLDPNDPKYNLN